MLPTMPCIRFSIYRASPSRAAATVPTRGSPTGRTAGSTPRATTSMLLPSHYMANHHGYEWLIGPDRALDPAKLFLVATELFGNGHSSSPSNTPEPFHGPRFPVMTIRDNVEAVRRLLADELKVDARARDHRLLDGRGAGVPVGGEPSRLRRSDRRDLGHRQGLAARHRAARRPDRRAHRGSRRSTAATTRRRRARASRAYGMVWLGWLYSQEWWRRELWKTRQPPIARSSRRSKHRRRTFFQNNDANDLILQARTWQRHDVGTTPGFDGDTEQRAPIDHRAGALHAVGDRPLLPGGRRAARGAVHSRMSRSCRFRRSGATRPAPAATRPIARFLNQHIAAFLAAAPK